MDRIMAYKKTIALSVRNSKRPNQRKQSFFSQFDGMVSSIEVTH
jgi:phage terminase large subunit